MQRQKTLVAQSPRDDFPRVIAQIGFGGYAGDGFTSGAAVGFGQFLPAIQRACQTGGDLRVETVEFEIGRASCRERV